MTVVILVAGSGTRFRDDKPKCLVDINGISLIEWTISLIRDVDKEIPIRLVTGHKSKMIEEYVNKLQIKNLKIIHNIDYQNDQNILSAQSGMRGVESDVLVLEGDCIFNETTMKKLISSIGENKNIIFTKDSVEMDKKNAIIKVNKFNKFEEYMIGKRPKNFSIEFWSNMTGAVLFNKFDIDRVIEWLESSNKDPKNTYYFEPLVDNKEIFDVDVEKLDDESDFLSFNTQVEYLQAMKRLGIKTSITLVDVESLKHVEDFSLKRVEWLKNKILEEKIWNKPICIDSEYGIVMDGQHRMEVAKLLKIKKIPAILFSHDEVDFWSLRENHIVDLESIIDKSLTGRIYPYKTVKYKFPINIPKCSINLEEL